MTKSRFTNKQIIFTPQQAKASTLIAKVCRNKGNSGRAF